MHKSLYGSKKLTEIELYDTQKTTSKNNFSNLCQQFMHFCTFKRLLLIVFLSFMDYTIMNVGKIYSSYISDRFAHEILFIPCLLFS